MAWTRIIVNQPPEGQKPSGTFIGEVGKTYEIRVRTLRENADPSDWSEIVERLAEIANPDVPMNINLSYDADTTTITLTWDAVPLATSYEVAWGIAAGLDDTNETVVAAASNSATFSMVVENTRYGFRVRALRTGATTSDYSEFSATEPYHKITTLAGAIPTLSAPVATPSTIVDGRIDLSWTRAAIAASYDLEYRTGSGSWTSIAVAQPVSGNVTYSFTGTADTAYEFRMRIVVTPTDKGDYSPTVMATAPSVITRRPTGTIQLSAAVNSSANGLITLSWNRIADATAYTVNWRRNSGRTVHSQRVEAFSTSTGNYLFLGAVNTDYTFSVYAENRIGVGTSSTTSAIRAVSASSTNSIVPSPPGIFAATPSDAVTGGIELEWNWSPNTLSYDLEWRTGSGSWTVVNVLNRTNNAGESFHDARNGIVPDFFYIFNGTAGTSYDFRLKSKNSNGDSSYSPIVSATAPTVTLDTAPTIPGLRDFVFNIVEDKNSDGHSLGVILSWKPIPLASSYKIRYKATIQTEWTEVTPPGNLLSYSFVPPIVSRDYEFQLQAVNSVGSSDWSSTTTFVRS